jgi:hypothetical protein
VPPLCVHDYSDGCGTEDHHAASCVTIRPSARPLFSVSKKQKDFQSSDSSEFRVGVFLGNDSGNLYNLLCKLGVTRLTGISIGFRRPSFQTETQFYLPLITTLQWLLRRRNSFFVWRRLPPPSPPPPSPPHSLPCLQPIQRCRPPTRGGDVCFVGRLHLLSGSVSNQ